MKPLEKARQDLEKAKKKRDASKKRLEADEFTVKECEAALMESENNEYVNEIRAWGLTVEELKEIRAAMQKKSPYWESTYKACNIPFTDFQIRYQPEQVRIVDGKRILEDTAFLCRKDNDHFLILPSIYEKLDLDDWLLAHLFFYDKDGKRCIGVELSEDD